MQRELTTNQLYELLKHSQEEQTNKLTNEIKKISEKYDDKIKKLETNLDQLQNHYLNFERYKRKNNIMVFGLNLGNENLLQNTIGKLNSLLGINLTPNNINNLFPVGREQKRGVLIQLTTYLKKQEIFRNTPKLKGSKISIVNDLCKEDRERQNILVKHLKEAKKNKKAAKIKGFKLEIDNKVYTVEELESGEKESESEPYSDIDDIDDEEIVEDTKNARKKAQHNEATAINPNKKTKQFFKSPKITRLNSKIKQNN